MPPPNVLKPSEFVHVTAAGDGIVLLDIADGCYYSLDQVASLIWRRLVAGEAPSEVRDALLAEYETTAELVDRDVQAVISDWLRRGWLIEAAESASLSS